MPQDTLALYSWPCIVSWCLPEGYRNGDQRRPMGPCGSGRTFLFLLTYFLLVPACVDGLCATCCNASFSL